MADIGDIYKFIQQTNTKSWDDWAKQADSNYDGVVIKAEFEEWIAKQFTQDAIDEFWYSIDTNRSAARVQGTDLKNLHAITKEEMARMEGIVKQAEYLNGLKIDAPNELHPLLRPQYIADVTNALNEEFSKFSQGKLSSNWSVEEAYDRIQIQYSQEYILRDLQEYEYVTPLNNIGYNFSEDEAIINKLFATCLNDPATKERIADCPGGTDDGVMAALKEVLLNFLATANITEVSNETKDYDGWSVLQEKALAYTIKQQLLSNPEYSEILTDDDYVNELAVQGYAFDYLHKSESFDVAQAGIHEAFIKEPTKQAAGIKYYFANITKDRSEALINNAVGELFTKIDDVEEGGVLTDLYLSSYGDSVRNKVQLELLNKVTDGTISPDIKTEVIDALYKNVENLFQTKDSNGNAGYVKFEKAEGYSYDYLNNLHDARVDVIVKQAAEAEGGVFSPGVIYGGEDTLKAIFNAFEQYCTALRNMGGAYKDAVDYVENTTLSLASTVNGCSLGNSKTFKATFEAMLKTLSLDEDNVSSIESVITAWTENIRNIVTDPISMYSFKLNATNLSVKSAETLTKEGFCSGITFPDGSVVKPNGGYTVTTNPTTANATIDNNGKLTFKAPVVSSNSTVTVTVEAKTADGTVVTDTFKVSVTARTVTDVINACAKPANPQTITKNDYIMWDNNLMTDYSLKELYNKDAMIDLHYDWSDNNDSGSSFSQNKETVKAHLTTIANTIVSVLAASGLNNAKLDIAATAVVEAFMNSMDTAWNVTIDNGKNATSESTRISDITKFIVDHNYRHTVSTVVDYNGNGKNHEYWFTSFKGLVDAILAEYKTLNGGL